MLALASAAPAQAEPAVAAKGRAATTAKVERKASSRKRVTRACRPRVVRRTTTVRKRTPPRPAAGKRVVAGAARVSRASRRAKARARAKSRARRLSRTCALKRRPVRKSARPQAPVVLVDPSLPAAAPTADRDPGGPDNTSPVEPEFFGAVADAAFATRGRARAGVLESLTRSGIGSIRQPFSWHEIERTEGTWTWRSHDQFVADTARRGIEVLPILFGAPDFAARANPDGTRDGGFYPPADNARFADFAARVVRRYGRDGEFWKAYPSVPYRPITSWEVWNEPNGSEFWRTGVDGADYARLLIAASGAIKAVDPAAFVVSGGLPSMGGDHDAIRPYLDAMYRAGAGPAMDAVGLHPYAPTPARMLDIVWGARQVMNRYGDTGKKLWLTEYGYPTGGPFSDYTQAEEGQTAMIVESARRAAGARDRLGIGKLVYYSLSDLPVWTGGQEFWGLYCGLFRVDGHPKPAASALAVAVAELTGRAAGAAPDVIPDIRAIVAGTVDNGGGEPLQPLG